MLREKEYYCTDDNAILFFTVDGGSALSLNHFVFKAIT